MSDANPQSPPQPILVLPVSVNNFQISYLLNNLGRMATEVARSESANSASVNPADVIRVNAYLKSLDGANDWIAPQPWLDMPHTYGKFKWAVEPLDTPFPSLQNEEWETLLRMILITHGELAYSESANMGSGITLADKGRLTALVGAARTFVTGYMASFTPLDLPASDIDVNAPTAKIQPV